MRLVSIESTLFYSFLYRSSLDKAISRRVFNFTFSEVKYFFHIFENAKFNVLIFFNFPKKLAKNFFFYFSKVVHFLLGGCSNMILRLFLEARVDFVKNVTRLILSKLFQSYNNLNV